MPFNTQAYPLPQAKRSEQTDSDDDFNFLRARFQNYQQRLFRISAFDKVRE